MGSALRQEHNVYSHATPHTQEERSVSCDRHPLETFPTDPFCCAHGKSPVLGLDPGRLEVDKIGVPAERSNPLIAPINVKHQFGKEVALGTLIDARADSRTW